MIVRLVVSIIYVIAGISAFIAFSILQNYPSCILGGLTGILAAVLTHLHYLKYKNHLEEWYSLPYLAKISIFGFGWFCFTFSIMVYYIVLETILKTPLLPMSESLVLPIVWSFMACKTASYLWLYASAYAIQQDSALLTEDPEESTS